jgi:hypothetical protein
MLDCGHGCLRFFCERPVQRVFCPVRFGLRGIWLWPHRFSTIYILEIRAESAGISTLTQARRRTISGRPIVTIVRKLLLLISPICPSDPADFQQSERYSPFNSRTEIQHMKRSLKSKNSPYLPFFQDGREGYSLPHPSAGTVSAQASTVVRMASFW